MYDKDEKYRILLAQAEALLEGENDGIARIARGRGVCGTAWERAETVVVPDVEEFPGHIACSGESRSEIVVPLLRGGAVTAVLDIDSRELAAFDGTDQRWLERLAALV